MRAIFIGTPEFAVPSLEAMANRHDVRLVVTQPDRPAGRGRKLKAPAVKRRAAELGLTLAQPRRVGEDESFARLAACHADVIAVVGYGQMIPKRIRVLTRHGCVNLHSSLLPKYRGAAPLSWAIVRGERETGVTTMRISRKMDAGDILLRRRTKIGRSERASDLARRLAPVGADLLLETLDRLEERTLQPTPQDDAAATYAPMLRRKDGLVDWSLPAASIYDRLRGLDPWPGIHTFFRNRRLRIWDAAPGEGEDLEPGRAKAHREGLAVGCGSGTLVLKEVQLEGRRRMGAPAFLRGWRLAPDEALGKCKN
ncbi:MAG: methionyl-tRNA formyltransferase [Bryobacterales bacterium]|nr:methionyl-tRNA formyltransferase [Bryobacterales bacterium]